MHIDLHAHSSMSDGSLSPEQLIDHAVRENVGILALCDHDTTTGIKRFIAYGKNKNITTIPGVELSATWAKGNCHIIGLGVRDDYEPLETVLREIRESRDKRNEIIIAKLNAFGLAVSLEDVERVSGGEVTARPHFARVLIEKGYVGTVKEAFQRYLAKGAPGYVDRYRLEPHQAVQLLSDAGALPVLAHPSQLHISLEEVEQFVSALKAYKLAGIEVYTPYTPDEHIQEYLKIAQKNGLMVTGGSDFHGQSKPDHRLGYYREDKGIPDSCTEMFHYRDEFCDYVM